MIPKFNNSLDIRLEDFKTRTYRIDFENKRIVGTVDGIQAMAQAVEKIVRTERYSERIYSGDYGIELNRLVNESTAFVSANIKPTLEEAFSPDSRIRRVDSVYIASTEVDSIAAEFTVTTDAGDIKSNIVIGG